MVDLRTPKAQAMVAWIVLCNTARLDWEDARLECITQRREYAVLHHWRGL